VIDISTRSYRCRSKEEMGSAEEGQQMMTEKRDKLVEALTPEDRHSVNAVLAKVGHLTPAFKYAIAFYLNLEPSERHPNIIEVRGSTPIDEADKKILSEVIRHISASMNSAQRGLICHELNRPLDKGGFVQWVDGPTQYVRI
jgi:hypothetical protein